MHDDNMEQLHLGRLARVTLHVHDAAETQISKGVKCIFIAFEN